MNERLKLRRKLAYKIIDSLSDKELKIVIQMIRLYLSGRELVSPIPNKKPGQVFGCEYIFRKEELN